MWWWRTSSGTGAAGEPRTPAFDVAIEAVDEVGNPTILATLAVIAAILPMAFVGGLMGPYMRPIPVGASAAMVFSLLVAFIVTPWAAVRILKPRRGARRTGNRKTSLTRLYRRVWAICCTCPRCAGAFWAGGGAAARRRCRLFYFQFVKVKMLPFDNKSEFQVIVDMPTGTTLEQTAARGSAGAEPRSKQPEVVNVQTYAGTARPSTSTAWCGITICDAGRMLPISR